MWEPFQERARRMVVLAQEEAERMGSGGIGTEHLLLGLVAEGENRAAKLLADHGIGLAILREAVGTSRAAAKSRGGEMVFTAEAKATIEFSFEVARESGHRFIGTEHFLTALLRQTGTTANRVLRQLLESDDRFQQLQGELAELLSHAAPEATISAASPQAMSHRLVSHLQIMDGEAALYGSCLQAAVAMLGQNAKLEPVNELAAQLYDAGRKTIGDARGSV